MHPTDISAELPARISPSEGQLESDLFCGKPSEDVEALSFRSCTTNGMNLSNLLTRSSRWKERLVYGSRTTSANYHAGKYTVKREGMTWHFTEIGHNQLCSDSLQVLSWTVRPLHHTSGMSFCFVVGQIQP